MHIFHAPASVGELQHASLFPKGLEQFRGDKALCDVTLVPGDSSDTFPVHRVIMASASDYFKAMFTGECGGVNPSPVHVRG